MFAVAPRRWGLGAQSQLHLATLAYLSLPVLVACGDSALIRGTVVGLTGEPLEGVVVQVAGTTFETTTNRDGRYSIGYVPGTVRLSFTKQSYSASSLELTLASETTVPAAAITLVKIPPKPGLWYVGQRGYEPLGEVELRTATQEFSFRWDQPTSITRYIAAEPTQSSSLVVPEGAKLRFVDNSDVDEVLLRMMPDNSVWKRTRYGVGLESKDDYQRVEEEIWQADRGLFVREVPATPGRFAFVVKGRADIPVNPPVYGPAVPFRVQVDFSASADPGPFGNWRGYMSAGGSKVPVEVDLALDDNRTNSSFKLPTGSKDFAHDAYALWQVAVARNWIRFLIPIGGEDSGDSPLNCVLEKKPATERFEGMCSSLTEGQRRWQIVVERPR